MKFIKKMYLAALSLLMLLFLCSCFSHRDPAYAVRKKYGDVLEKYFDEVSWGASPEGLVEYRGRIKEGLLYGALGIEMDSFTEDKAAELFKSREFSSKLIKTFEIKTVYDMYTRNACDLDMELALSCPMQKEYNLSPVKEEDLFDFINSVTDKKEMKKIMIFVLGEVQKRIYKVGSLVVIRFSYDGKAEPQAVNFACPSCIPLAGDCFMSRLVFRK